MFRYLKVNNTINASHIFIRDYDIKSQLASDLEVVKMAYGVLK